jgi:hypothetical protein
MVLGMIQILHEVMAMVLSLCGEPEVFRKRQGKARSRFFAYHP